VGGHHQKCLSGVGSPKGVVRTKSSESASGVVVRTKSSEGAASVARTKSSEGAASVARTKSSEGASSKVCASQDEGKKVKVASFCVEEDSSSDEEGESSDEDPQGTAKRFSQQEAQAREKVKATEKSVEDERDEVGKNGLLVNIVGHQHFEFCTATVLLLNAIAIGVQVELIAQGQGDAIQAHFAVVNFIFCFIFSAELLLRLGASTPRQFYTGPEWSWNIFDTVVVVLQVIEVFVSGAVDKQTHLGGVIRISRAVRILRLVSALRSCRSFRVLVTAIAGTLKNCAWAVVLLLLVIYVFSIIFTQSVVDFLRDRTSDSGFDPDRDPQSDLRIYFGSLPRSVFTLYKSIIGGIDWQTAVLPLSDVGWGLVLTFLVYISFVCIAVLNVVQGLFLQSAIEQAQTDQEHTIQLRLQEKQRFCSRLRTLFNELDTSGDGAVSLSEFETHLTNAHMQAFLQTFEIENTDAWTLFRLLDADGGGSVDLDEFIEGCIKLKGTAKSIQVAQLAFHHKWIMEALADVVETVGRTQETVENLEQKSGGSTAPRSVGSFSVRGLRDQKIQALTKINPGKALANITESG
jgi:hypothetical protein